jgi:hypothetical protein
MRLQEAALSEGNGNRKQAMNNIEPSALPNGAHVAAVPRRVIATQPPSQHTVLNKSGTASEFCPVNVVSKAEVAHTLAPALHESTLQHLSLVPPADHLPPQRTALLARETSKTVQELSSKLVGPQIRVRDTLPTPEFFQECEESEPYYD